MTEPAAESRAESRPEANPVALAERIDSLDVLRGFAMFGSTYFNPSFYGMWDGSGYAIWYLSHLFADQKFMTVFSLLFGVGIALFSARKDEAGQPARRYHYRRLGVCASAGRLADLAPAFPLWPVGVVVAVAHLRQTSAV
jgi:uncharacterized protein